MKWYYFMVFVFLSACSATNGPQLTHISTIPGLKLIDTLDFGEMPLGTSKDLALHFQNTGQDTIYISQALSQSEHFSFVDTAQRHFWIAPGKQIPIQVRCTVLDTSSERAFDTVRFRDYENLVVLRNSWKPFSSVFPSAPRTVSLDLRGLIGQWHGTPSLGFNFFSDGSTGLQGDTILFHDSHYEVICTVPTNTTGAYESDRTDIQCVIDSRSHSIEWLKAYYSKSDAAFYGPCGHGFRTISKTIVAHDIPLTQNGSKWTAVVPSATLPATVDDVQYLENSVGAFGNRDATLSAVTGYDSTATLTISIQ